MICNNRLTVQSVKFLLMSPLHYFPFQATAQWRGVLAFSVLATLLCPITGILAMYQVFHARASRASGNNGGYRSQLGYAIIVSGTSIMLGLLIAGTTCAFIYTTVRTCSFFKLACHKKINIYAERSIQIVWITCIICICTIETNNSFLVAC